MFGSAARPLERPQTSEEAVRFSFPRKVPGPFPADSWSIAGTGNHQMTSRSRGGSISVIAGPATTGGLQGVYPSIASRSCRSFWANPLRTAPGIGPASHPPGIRKTNLRFAVTRYGAIAWGIRPYRLLPDVARGVSAAPTVVAGRRLVHSRMREGMVTPPVRQCRRGGSHERAEGLRVCPTGASPPRRTLGAVIVAAAISYDRRRAD
jgi:hypothetical protein